MATAPVRVLLLAIDAANPQLLQQWAHDGTLPHIQLLMSRGLTGRTRSVPGFYVGSTWPSFYTGVTPARHGFHYLTQLKRGTYDFYRPADHGIVKCDPFWMNLSDAGRRVAILDVPLSRIADRPLNGVQIVEWGSHDAVFGFGATPSHAADEIRSRFVYPVSGPCDGERKTSADYRAFTDRLVHAVRTKTELTRYFLAQGGWDFYMQVFTESHCVGHQCWHLHDVNHPAHDPAVLAEIGDPLRTVYAAIDAAIGDVLADAGDAFVLLLDAHGMSYWHGANFLLQDILLRLGATQPVSSRSDPRNVRSIVTDSARLLWRRVPPSIRNPLAPLRDAVAQALTVGDALPTVDADLSSSFCFVVFNGLAVSGIRLNLVGREPQGILEPGPRADAFCDQLGAELLKIVDERTGRPLIRRVVRTGDLCQGPCLDDLPDLLVEWSEEVPTGSVRVGGGIGAAVRASSAKIGTVEGVNQYGRSGEHRIGGLFIAAAPGMQSGRLAREVSILDFAPTFATMFGVDATRFDGLPIEELLHTRLPIG
jgi:predicted AlkP superfamily phosphohydrolase/phosphomutase